MWGEKPHTLIVCGGGGPRPSRNCSGGDVEQQILIELSLVVISRFVARNPPSASAFITKKSLGSGGFFSLVEGVFRGPLADEAEEDIAHDGATDRREGYGKQQGDHLKKVRAIT